MVVRNRAVAESFQLEFEYLWGLAKPRAASEPDWDKKSCLERLNAARFADLVAVKGIGDILALRILEYREANGSFATVDELSQVGGIGPALRTAILEKLCSSAS
jgi:competence ComEA-like helix-hairpin-helix protein